MALAPLAAQPPKRIEAFGHIGALRYGGDEGSPGSGAAYGGSVMVPFTPRFGLDFGVLTSRRGESDGLENTDLRRTLILPTLVWRKGTERGYFFLGGGMGAQIERFAYRGPPPPGNFTATDTGATLHMRTGGVFAVKERLLFRADFVWAHRWVLPNIGINAGVGYRF